MIRIPVPFLLQAPQSISEPIRARGRKHVKNSGKREALQQRLASLFQDRELFLRTEGHVKFLKITAKAQRTAAISAAALVVGWVGFTGFMFTSHVLTANERTELAAKEVAVARSESKVEAYRDRVESTAAELEARQKYLEALMSTHVAPDAPPSPEATPAIKPAAANQIKGGTPDIAKELAALDAIRVRQDALAAQLLSLATDRTARAEAAIRDLGINPAVLAANARQGMGGPFLPLPESRLIKKIKDPVMLKLNSLFNHMASLEQALVALPSGQPSVVMMTSSSYGYRSDPFTGAGAMHSGLDFPGPIGSPIMASAPGVVSFVGQKSGYGNVVEVDHGSGFMTRYAHLSGFDTRVGAKVSAGQKIARMGSTGRSTGSHLHFEVRLNGEALDPRRFLEADTDVLAGQIHRRRDGSPF
ncbi:M23 family peptidase [Pseudonocardia sp. TMWB2A]